MSNAVIHKLEALVARYTTLCLESERQTLPVAQKRVREYLDLTQQQANATRKQGWTGLGAAGLGLGGTLLATAVGAGHFSKTIATVCSQGGNIFTKNFEAQQSLLAGKAGLIQNHFLPAAKQTMEKSHQAMLSAAGALSRVQEQGTRSGIR